MPDFRFGSGIPPQDQGADQTDFVYILEDQADFPALTVGTMALLLAIGIRTPAIGVALEEPAKSAPVR